MIMVVGAGIYETVIVITQTHLQYTNVISRNWYNSSLGSLRRDTFQWFYLFQTTII